MSELPEITDTDQTKISFRKPFPEDGKAVYKLVKECKPLDVNSMYCNLLQCSHFRNTSIVAERNGQMAGFVSGYRIPDTPDTLFVWQVAVAPEARGQGLASRMLNELVEQQDGAVRYLHTSITESNQASWNTFRRLAKALDTEFQSWDMFESEQHFGGTHDTEILVQIGPFPNPEYMTQE